MGNHTLLDKRRRSDDADLAVNKQTCLSGGACSCSPLRSHDLTGMLQSVTHTPDGFGFCFSAGFDLKDEFLCEEEVEVGFS